MTGTAMISSGSWVQKIRLWSGLVLFVFALTHFLNHALGIVSVELMEAVQEPLMGAWDTVPGGLLLVGSAIAHVVLGLWKIAQRRTWRMPFWEAFQIGLIIFIPYQLIAHIVGTMGASERFGIDTDYNQVLVLLWPGLVVEQTLLLVVVWLHGIIGIHYWLRLKPWYEAWFPVFLASAILVPALATWGWTTAAERLVLNEVKFKGFTREHIEWFVMVIDSSRYVSYGLIAAAFGIPIGRWLLSLTSTTVAVTYPGGQVFRAAPGQTLLEISRANNVPHASVCGGRARCSTCRTLVIEGGDALNPIDEAEAKVLKRINADERVRLACRMKPQAPLTVQPLVPANGTVALARMSQDAYHWGVEKPAVIMFADLRNFTGLSEERLPYDTVFLLNRYLGLMREAIEEAGGQVDKFIGDGIMALFGISNEIGEAASQSLKAAALMARALDQLNDEFSNSLNQPLAMGIGIHLGPVILGRIGSAGAGQSNTITALGDTVNAASRLETASKDLGSILVASRPVLKAAGLELDDEGFVQINVKGKRKSLDVAAIHQPTLLLGENPALALTQKSSPAEPPLSN